MGGVWEGEGGGDGGCGGEAVRGGRRARAGGAERGGDVQGAVMGVDEAGTWALAAELGGPALVDLIVEHSHTCYLGDRTRRHDWGYGCGDCPACQLRAKGWEAWVATTT